MNKPRIRCSSSIGFCSGVKTSINILKSSLLNKEYKKYYLFGNIVHNKKVTNEFQDLGCEFIEKDNFEKCIELKDDETLVISAHGISDILKNKLINCNINIIDTTCPIVKKSYNKIMEYINKGYDVIYFGKSNHAETESIIHNSCNIHLIESIDDIKDLNIKNDLIAFGCQTTISYLKYKEMKDMLIEKFPKLIDLETMCPLTKARQTEMINLLENSKAKIMVVVIGDPLSNNTDMLYNIAIDYGVDAVKINSLKELKIDYFNYDVIYITSGTSAKDEDVTYIKEYIENIVDIISDYE